MSALNHRSLKRKMCHKCVTMCQIKNRIRRSSFVPIELHAKFELKISKGVAKGVNTEKKYKLQPVPPLMPSEAL